MKFFKKDEKKIPAKAKNSSGAAAPVIAAIKSAWITEKAGGLGKLRQYVFKAAIRATKPEVKASVEEKYKVGVVSVRMTRMPGKAKRRGGQYGKAREFKKAIVTVKEGDKIDIMPS